MFFFCRNDGFCLHRGATWWKKRSQDEAKLDGLDRCKNPSRSWLKTSGGRRVWAWERDWSEQSLWVQVLGGLGAIDRFKAKKFQDWHWFTCFLQQYLLFRKLFEVSIWSKIVEFQLFWKKQHFRSFLGLNSCLHTTRLFEVGLILAIWILFSHHFNKDY